jgi:hypothetical protein
VEPIAFPGEPSSRKISTLSIIVVCCGVTEQQFCRQAIDHVHHPDQCAGSEWSAPNECQTHRPGSREAGRRVRSLSRNALPREPGANPGVSTANAGFRAPSVRNTKGSPTAAKGKAPSYDPQCPTAISDKLSHGNRRRRIPLPKKNRGGCVENGSPLRTLHWPVVETRLMGPLASLPPSQNGVPNTGAPKP